MYRQRKQKIEQGIRSQVESKFGQGKNDYNLDKVSRDDSFSRPL